MTIKKNLCNILIGIVFTIFFISVGLLLAIQFKPLYYFDIEHLKIVESSGLTKEVIIENYDALIDYCSPFFQGELKFPSLAQSPSGTSHFAEVKVLFNLFFYSGVVCFFLLIFFIIYKYKKKDTSYLLVSSITAIVLPLSVGAACAINFEKAFIIFHKLFFQNDDWLFDSMLDPVITILPETFFLHSALIIIGTVLLGSLFLWILHRRIHRKQSVEL